MNLYKEIFPKLFNMSHDTLHVALNNMNLIFREKATKHLLNKQLLNYLNIKAKYFLWKSAK